MTSLTDDLDRTVPGTPASPARRSYGPVGFVVAALVGLGGLSLAGWSVYENTRTAPRPKSASDVVRAAGKGGGPAGDRPSPGAGPEGSPAVARSRAARPAMGDDEIPTFIDDAEFVAVTNPAQAGEVVALLGAAAGEQSTKIEGLTATPLQTSDQINGALTRFLGPLTQGEIQDGGAFISANGGNPPASGTIPAVVQQIAAVLKFCELDTTHTKVRKAPKLEGPLADMLSKLPPGATPMMINRNRLGDGNEISSLTMPLAGLLDGSVQGVAADAPRVEVTMPARLKGEEFTDKKFLLGIILVQNAKSNTWVPQSLQFHSNDGETIKALSKAIRPRSAGSDDGAPRPKTASGRG
ncbi:MAG: hypothetical protein KF805_14505 [Phycisphaeraceae bacterium]|nr:hypothetical protein [Phycisphaeraceae bacterium]